MALSLSLSLWLDNVAALLSALRRDSMSGLYHTKDCSFVPRLARQTAKRFTYTHFAATAQLDLPQNRLCEPVRKGDFWQSVYVSECVCCIARSVSCSFLLPVFCGELLMWRHCLSERHTLRRPLYLSPSSSSSSSSIHSFIHSFVRRNCLPASERERRARKRALFVIKAFAMSSSYLSLLGRL